MFSWKITTRCLIGVAVRAAAPGSFPWSAPESAGTSPSAIAPNASSERLQCMGIPPVGRAGDGATEVTLGVEYGRTGDGQGKGRLSGPAISDRLDAPDPVRRAVPAVGS